MLIYFFLFNFFIKKFINKTITEASKINNPPKPLPISRTINIPYSIIINPTAPVTKKTLEIFL